MRFRQFGLLVPFLVVLTTSAFAATTWYVNRASGSDSNTCLSSAMACKTIGHAISNATSGDSIRVAAGTYKENLSVGFSLNLVGAGTSATIIDGGGVNTVVTISAASAHVTLSGLTITHGYASKGGVFLMWGL